MRYKNIVFRNGALKIRVGDLLLFPGSAVSTKVHNFGAIANPFRCLLEPSGRSGFAPGPPGPSPV